MHIQRAARISGDFAEQLEKIAAKEELPLETTEGRLNPERSSDENLSYEGRLDSQHKKEAQPLPEARLKEYKAKNSPNKDLQGLPEKRLDQASKASYPHRNPEAWERTGDQRPINSLPSELPGSSDEDKRKRWEQAYNKAKATKRVLDKDVGKQKTIEAARLYNYVQYKDDPDDAKRRYSKVIELDRKLASMMEKASSEKRFLTKEEAEEVTRAKAEKSKLLGIL